MPQTAYIVRCAHRTNGQPYTVNINADNPTAAKASAANTGHIVEHVMLANDPLAITPAPGVSSETLMQKAMLEEMRALRAGHAKSAKRSGDRYVIMILVILFVAGFFNPILWVIAVALCVLRVGFGLVLWLWRMATRKVA